jgi:transketolase
MSLRGTFAEVSFELAKSDPSIVVLVGDISHGLFTEFRAEFPDRYFNVGIMEPAMASIAAGLAMVGFKPIVHTIAPFLVERSFEQLKLDFGYQNLSAMFVSVGGAFDYSNLGCTHHSYLDIPMVASIEGSRVFSPVSAHELRALMRQVMDTWGGISYFKLTENGVMTYPSSTPLEIGEPVLVRLGIGRIAIVSLGPTLVQVQDALSRLEISYPENGVRHVHVHSFEPINLESCRNLLQNTDRVIVVEQLNSLQGLGSKLAISLGLPGNARIEGIGINGFVRDYGSYQDLLTSTGLSEDCLELALLKALGQE